MDTADWLKKVHGAAVGDDTAGTQAKGYALTVGYDALPVLAAALRALKREHYEHLDLRTGEAQEEHRLGAQRFREDTGGALGCSVCAVLARAAKLRTDRVAASGEGE